MLVSGYLTLHEDTTATAVAALERAVTPFAAVEASSWPLIDAFGADRFFAATSRATILLANEREARALAGVSGEAAARLLSERYALVCVKLGAEGVVAVSDNEVHRIAAERVESPNATGAGDAFDGVLLAALARGMPLQDALRRACHAGALAAAGDETWPELTQRGRPGAAGRRGVRYDGADDRRGGAYRPERPHRRRRSGDQRDRAGPAAPSEPRVHRPDGRRGPWGGGPSQPGWESSTAPST